ncbi:venom carboxylesterase-6 precursor [Apis mellifera carnica]|nr:venom carboxylesterase-6 precursor [Apis mellifera carnica]
MQQLLINFYTSFAIQGIPYIDEASWPSLNPNDPDFRYLHIVNFTNIKMEVNNNFANKSFWKTIPFNENKLN